MIDRYFARLQEKLTELAEAERESLQQAADRCVECLARQGVLHVFDTGHLVSQELINRAGGLVAMTPLTFGLNVNSPNPFRQKKGDRSDVPSTGEIIDLALRQSTIQPGDVLFIGTVSGKSELPVELALRAKAYGVTVIALTAVEYSSQLTSQHPSGKRLFEVADLVIDNHSPYGDAMLEVEGLDRDICPFSGIGAAAALWAIVAAIAEEMLARGLTPTFFRSVNRPDGPADVEATRQRYAEKGY
jgi:uncharacterized phosphosugar-binding protein